MADLKEEMPAEEFDQWMLWDEWFPLDDQANFALPMAGLHAVIANQHRAPGSPPLSYVDCLMFKGRVPIDPEIGEVEGW